MREVPVWTLGTMRGESPMKKTKGNLRNDFAERGRLHLPKINRQEKRRTTWLTCSTARGHGWVSCRGGMHHAGREGSHAGMRKWMRRAHTVTLARWADEFAGRTPPTRKMPQPPDLGLGKYRWTAGCSRITRNSWMRAAAWVPGNGCCIMWRSGTRIARIFFAPTRKEHIFGRGQRDDGLDRSARFMDIACKKGEKIRIETMMYNPTATSYEKSFLEVVIPIQETSGDASAAAPAEKNVYPAWMDCDVRAEIRAMTCPAGKKARENRER